MAWTAPRTWVAGELETDTIFNTHVRDNLLYLHGDAGAVTINSDVTAPNLNAVGSANAALVAQGTANGSFARLSLIAKTAGGAAVDYRYLTNALGGGEWLVFDNAASATRLHMTSAGWVGIGPNAPQSVFHVLGRTPGNVAQGGFLILEASAVSSLQTLTASSTVTRAAGFLIIDRNNTGGAIGAPSYTVSAVGAGGFTYLNTDTITVAVTAGGAITVQRTTGTNGTHDISMLVIYL